MSVRIDITGEVVTPYLQGELDHHSAREMREAIDDAVNKNMPTLLVLDFSEISFMDSSGIGMIIGRFKLISEARVRNLEEYNKTATEVLKNARNAVAGAIRNLDPKETEKRKLDYFCYDILSIENTTAAEIVQDLEEGLSEITNIPTNLSETGEYVKNLINLLQVVDKCASWQPITPFVQRGALPRIANILIGDTVISVNQIEQPYISFINIA